MTLKKVSILILLFTYKGLFGQNCPTDTQGVHQLFYEKHASLSTIDKLYKIDSLFNTNTLKKDQIAYLKNYKSILCLRVEKFTVAITCAEEAITAFPDYDKFLFQHGEATSAVGSFEEAFQSYRNASKNNFDPFLCRLGMAKCKFGMKDFKGALLDYDDLIVKYPSENILLLLKAQVLIEMGKYSESKTSLLTYKDSVPNNAEAYFYLSLVAAKEKDIKKSMEYYIKTVELDAHYSDKNIIKGIETFLDGNKEEACGLWNSVIKISKPLAKSYIESFCKEK